MEIVMKRHQSRREAIGDDFTTARIRKILAADPATTYYDICVATSQGVVELTGCVETLGERAQALAIARNIKGVLRVEDSLQIRTIY
jgi:osmotically-inducible protein OsmY